MTILIFTVLLVLAILIVPKKLPNHYTTHEWTKVINFLLGLALGFTLANL